MYISLLYFFLGIQTGIFSPDCTSSCITDVGHSSSSSLSSYSSSSCSSSPSSSRIAAKIDDSTAAGFPSKRSLTLNHDDFSELLTCCVCKELFSSPERMPIALKPCGHVLCTSCLDTLTQRSISVWSITCPLCRGERLRSAISDRNGWYHDRTVLS